MLDESMTAEDGIVSKGLNQKKEQKKKPAKSLAEKREAKKAKKVERSTSRPV